MLLHVSVYNENNESSIEELSQEGSLDDRSFLLTHSILTNPAYESDDDFLKDSIDDNNNNGNGEGKEFG
jgi:hypothetical protein